MRPSEALAKHNQDVKNIFSKYPLIENPKVFGSVSRGEDTEESDIDFLIQAERGVTLFMVSRLKNELSELLGIDVDIVTENQLPPKHKNEIIETAMNLPHS
ncbi:nucleotidyltransferase family protein [Oligella urethralis]|uniref:Nucleotidyltransferase domain n=1 Tax=Oligella urethralis TaxID=90245 RepID=A0A2X1V007_9BURK|nr:nucleotidyltransferase family protein [Oligella urethralis]SPY07516.1 Nucleotidyltransferase domain [Oligella urethralis]SPY09343.1 Nucleotidyltransferase domain [Oligella urethralis]SUA63840.1 Nucleotidyltransferase domain [Oligella urethralis]